MNEPLPADGRPLLDAWTRVTHAIVHQALTGGSIPHLFIKGPSVADWLYQPGERIFVDVDVLVPPDDLQRALGALQGLGYADTIHGTVSGEAADHSHPLRRLDGRGC